MGPCFLAVEQAAATATWVVWSVAGARCRGLAAVVGDQ